jgi:hypothetical protein
MAKKLKLKILFLFIFLPTYFLIAQIVKAAPLSLSIDPPITTIQAIPPTTTNSYINIQNNENSQIALRIEIKPFKANEENGELEYLNEMPPFFRNIQILDKDDVPVENITLGPKQKKNLKLSIAIPKDENISDYYFSVIFISTGSPSDTSNLSANRIGITTNVLLSIGSPELPKTTVEEFSSNIFFEKGPVPFTVRLKNTGSHFIKPKGQIIIKNMFGQSIKRLDLFSVNILSDSIRAIPNDTYMQELRLKNNSKLSFDFKHPTILWKGNFLIGLYSATLNIYLSDNVPSFTKTIYFFAFPLQILIIILIITLAIVATLNRIKANTDK